MTNKIHFEWKIVIKNSILNSILQNVEQFLLLKMHLNSICR